MIRNSIFVGSLMINSPHYSNQGIEYQLDYSLPLQYYLFLIQDSRKKFCNEKRWIVTSYTVPKYTNSITANAIFFLFCPLTGCIGFFLFIQLRRMIILVIHIARVVCHHLMKRESKNFWTFFTRKRESVEIFCVFELDSIFPQSWKIIHVIMWNHTMKTLY